MDYGFSYPVEANCQKGYKRHRCRLGRPVVDSSHAATDVAGSLCRKHRNGNICYGPHHFCSVAAVSLVSPCNEIAETELGVCSYLEVAFDLFGVTSHADQVGSLPMPLMAVEVVPTPNHLRLSSFCVFLRIYIPSVGLICG